MNLFTSPEAMLLFSAATNPALWTANEEGGYLSYQTPGLPGLVRVEARPAEDFDAIAARLRGVHPDAAQVIAWALSELVEDPREALPEGTTKTQSWALSRIVAESLGTDPWKVTPAKRAELLQRVADALWLASRARVECERPGVFNMGGGRREAVKVAAAPLLIQRLDLDAGGVPRLVEVALSRAWVAPLTETRAQYLPVGDTFARLASGRPGGALARSIALWVVSQCRIHRHDASAGTMKMVTPGEILQRFGAGELSSKTHASRLLDAWAGALSELVEAGLIAPHADADPAALRSRLGVSRGPNTGRDLLSVPAPAILPGPLLLVALEALEMYGDPLKVAKLPPKSGETTPEKWLDCRGKDATNRKEQSVSGVAPEVAPPSATRGTGRRRPCPVCGEEPSRERRADRKRGGAR